MPIAVHVPVRLRVSAGVLAAHPAAIDGAVSRALGRALARSRTEVLGRTGGYLGVHLGVPEITWAGANLQSVPEAVRRATERRMIALVSTATRASGLAAPASAASPLTGRAAEPWDPRRARSFGRYAVDSYEGGTDAIFVRRPGGSGPADPQVPFIRVWEIAEVGAYDRVYVRQRIQGEALVQGVTLAAVYGILVRAPAGWTLIISADGFTGDRTATVTFGRQTRRRPFVRPSGEIDHRDEEMVPPLTAASATETALAAEGRERVDQLHQMFGPGIETELRDLFDPGEERDGHLLSEADLNALIHQEKEATLVEMASGVRGSFLLRIDWGDVAFNIALPESLAARIGWDGTTPATVLPSVVEEQRPGSLPIGTGTDGEFNPETARPQARGGGGGPAGGSRFGTRGEGTGTGPGSIFPRLGGGTPMVCAPFLDAEPTLDKLPTEAGRLRQLVAEIAERLDMMPCEYPATFCICAAATLSAHAAAVGAMADRSTTGALTLPPSGGRPGSGGNMGHATFRPTVSRGIQLMRRLSQAAARIAALRRLIRRVYLNGEGRAQIGGDFARNPVGWVLRFEEAVSPNMQEGVGTIFAQTCQIIMLQLLETSAQEITARKQNLRLYAPLFREVLIRRLCDIGGLTALRDRLRAHEIARDAVSAFGTVTDRSLAHAGDIRATPGATGALALVALAAWATAAKGVADVFVSVHAPSYAPGAAMEIIIEGGVAKIRDGHGLLWSREALDRAIVEQRGAAESIDPLIQQLADIPGTVDRFRADPGSGSAETILSEMLAEMARLNAEKRQEAGADPLFGLQVGRIQETTQSNQVPGLLYALSGVHLLAHEQLFEFFGAERDAYIEGVDHVFSVELGKTGLEHFFVFTGLVLLAVICAPAAFVAGVGVAGHQVEKAWGREDLYRALINPGLVLNRAEIELERYIAYVGLALALLPEAGTAARAISAGVRGAARSGAAVGVQQAARSVMRDVSRQVTEQLARDLLPALVKELGINLFMEQVVIPQVVGPIIAAVEREMALRTSVGGTAGAQRLLDEIERAAAERAARPVPGHKR